MEPILHTAASAPRRYELRFDSLHHPGRGFAFPCNAQGHVAQAQLSERGRISYQRARGRVGHELTQPVVVPVA